MDVANSMSTVLRPKLLVCAVLAIQCLVIYGQTVTFDFVNYDDDRFVTENPQVQAGLTREGFLWAFTMQKEAYFIPVTWFTHMLDCQLYGLWAGGHHLTSLIFHALNSILLFLILSRLSGRMGPSAFAAMLFAVHPLHVESVAWISERKDVVSTFFWLLTMAAYAWYAARPAFLRYMIAVLCLCLGLMAKPMLVSLPFVLLLMDYWPLNRYADHAGEGAGVGGLVRRAAWLVLEKAPLFLLVFGCAVTTAILQKHSGAMTMGEAIPLTSRVTNAIAMAAVYLAKMVWPVDLAVLYPHPFSMRPYGQIAAASAALAVLSLFAAWRWRARPHAAVGWLWYLGTLVPVSGLVQIGIYAGADRYTYVPLIGIFILIAWDLADVAAAGPGRQRLAACFATVAVLIFMALAANQTRYWRDSIALFEHALPITRDNAVTRNNLAAALLKAGRYEEAMAQYREVVRLDPESVNARNNLGNDAMAHARWKEAEAHFRVAIHVNPGYARARHSLAKTLIAQGHYQEARTALETALRMDPGCLTAHYSLARLLQQLGEPQEAQRSYQHMLDIDQRNCDAYLGLGIVAETLGRPDEAIRAYEKVLRIDPRHVTARMNLAIALVHQGKVEEAARNYREILQVDPNNADAHFNLGVILQKMGNVPEAVECYKRALALSPSDATFRRFLDRATGANSPGARVSSEPSSMPQGIKDGKDDKKHDLEDIQGGKTRRTPGL